MTTLNKLLGQFTKLTKKLDDLVVANTDQAAIERGSAQLAVARAEALDAEAARAASVSQKIRELIGG